MQECIAGLSFQNFLWFSQPTQMGFRGGGAGISISSPGAAILQCRGGLQCLQDCREWCGKVVRVDD